MVLKITNKWLTIALFGKLGAKAAKGPGPIQMPITEDFDQEEKTNTPSYT